MTTQIYYRGSFDIADVVVDASLHELVIAHALTPRLVPRSSTSLSARSCLCVCVCVRVQGAQYYQYKKAAGEPAPLPPPVVGTKPDAPPMPPMPPQESKDPPRPPPPPNAFGGALPPLPPPPPAMDCEMEGAHSHEEQGARFPERFFRRSPAPLHGDCRSSLTPRCAEVPSTSVCAAEPRFPGSGACSLSAFRWCWVVVDLAHGGGYRGDSFRLSPRSKATRQQLS